MSRLAPSAIGTSVKSRLAPSLLGTSLSLKESNQFQKSWKTIMIRGTYANVANGAEFTIAAAAMDAE